MQIPDNFCRILEPDNPDFNERFACSDCGENFITLCDAARLKQTIAELRAEVERLSWKPITRESVFDPDIWYSIAATGPLGEIWYSTIEGAQFQRPEAARHLLEIGRTHYRPINPPASTKGEDNARTN